MLQCVGWHGRWSTSSQVAATATATADFVSAGYYISSGTPVPCPANTAAPAVRLISDATSCPPCAGGLSTGGLTAQRTCGKCPHGHACIPVLSSAKLTACPPASPHACLPRCCTGYVEPGMMYNAASATVAPCPVNTYSSTWRLTSRASSCIRCPTGTSTGGLTGQTTCGT
jgi:hypothetical protein